MTEAYRNLDAAHIVTTAERLQRRIEERFPGSGLAGLAGEITAVAAEATEQAERLAAPNWPVRVANVLLTLSIVGLLLAIVLRLKVAVALSSYSAFIGALEPSLGAMVFIGAFILFFWNLETRWKRHRAMQAIHELRSLAHVVDMHQLNKNPEKVLHAGRDTASSWPLELDRFQLGRYLDYCCELLSILSKIAALYATSFRDAVSLEGVDRIEALTTGLSRKIWEKSMVLYTEVPAEPAAPRAEPPPRDLDPPRRMTWGRDA